MDEANIELAKEVFDRYRKCTTKLEYNNVLKEISSKYNKTTAFLRQIKSDYYKYCASNKEKIEHDAVKEKMNKYLKYKDVIDSLCKMNEIERISYIIENDISRSDFNQFFTVYSKKIEINPEVLELKDWINDYFDNRYKNSIVARKKTVYEQSKKCFEHLISNGYYYYKDYANDFYKMYCHDKYSFIQLFQSYTEFLKGNDISLYKYYTEKMEQNRLLMFQKQKSKIDYFINNINELDIVDYYVIFNMNIRAFLRLNKNFISKEEKILYSLFFKKYLEVDSDIISDEQVLNSNYFYFNTEPTLEDKKTVLEYMKNNNVPNVYFSVALKKYLSGNLRFKKR